MTSSINSLHCIHVIDHIDETRDAPKAPPTDPKSQKLDAIVELWFFDSRPQSLTTPSYSTKASTIKLWLNIEALFCFFLDGSNRNGKPRGLSQPRPGFDLLRRARRTGGIQTGKTCTRHLCVTREAHSTGASPQRIPQTPESGRAQSSWGQ
ncbi:hypothetical protein LXL04_036612 [Taraxacum kok-saghyz]